MVGVTKNMTMSHPGLPIEWAIFIVICMILLSLRALLLIGGFVLAVQVIRHRGHRLFGARGYQLLPMLLFAATITDLNLWLIVQPMTMGM